MQAILVALLLFMGDDAKVANRFSDLEMEDAFRPYLTSNVLLMEVTGAKIIRLTDGKKVILSVASTAIKDGSAKDRLRAERVCRAKALANVVAERQGVQVAHMEKLEEKSRIVMDEKGETGTSVSELLQVTKTKVEGIAKDMPVVGRWKSKDGEVFYMALGAIISKDGEAIQGGPGYRQSEGGLQN
jgi:hypothetical protein